MSRKRGFGLEKQHSDRKAAQKQKDELAPERERRGETTDTPATDLLGATEQQVAPLTPPMARSDEQPNDKDRGKEPHKDIDPADELTPG
jgi:hypothetical protein